ncbi:MAG: bifunctional UDP-N-acetylglucosamine diphosphorylase/glucosamine-1-phosphate N-acetyltransferase GlmU, partial [Acidimicrobiia bacterium]
AARGPLESQVEVRNLAPELNCPRSAVMDRERPLAAIVLAAGEGTRMRSELPKVLHPICGRPMLLWVLDSLRALPLTRIVVVVGHGGQEVTKAVQAESTLGIPIECVEQSVRLGTGDAVRTALALFADELESDDDVLVLPGDTPLVTSETFAALIDAHGDTATVLTANISDPDGYGRVVRDERGEVRAIVEHKDASAEERASTEINTSVYCFRRTLLAPALRRLTPENAQGELYLTDAIAVLRNAGHHVNAVVVRDAIEVMGVNDRAQLAEAERVVRARINTAWMRSGVSMTDPEHTYIDASVTLASDVRLLPGVMLEGTTAIESGAVIGPDCRLIDTTVAVGAVVRQSNAIESTIGASATVGPFASLRPGSVVGVGAHIGSFVELKNAIIGDGAKVPHLSYIGDAQIGPRSNIGAGTVTANYDGVLKHRTVIGADVRTGVHTVLRAPVTIGDGAYTGAGAVVTRDVPPGALAKGVPAEIEEGWAERNRP